LSPSCDHTCASIFINSEAGSTRGFPRERINTAFALSGRPARSNPRATSIPPRSESCSRNSPGYVSHTPDRRSTPNRQPASVLGRRRARAGIP
jgi:hypothetical protein